MCVCVCVCVCVTDRKTDRVESSDTEGDGERTRSKATLKYQHVASTLTDSAKMYDQMCFISLVWINLQHEKSVSKPSFYVCTSNEICINRLKN